MSEGLAQGPYVAVRVGFQPATFRTQGSERTSEPPRPHSDVEGELKIISIHRAGICERIHV